MMHTRTRPKQARRRLLVLAVAATVVVGACSSSSKSGSSGASSTSSSAPTASSAAATAVLGPKKPATGPVLTIGYVYDGVSSTIDRTDELTAAQASVKYVNNYLGGIAGRPIKLDVCATNVTSAGTANCVTKMVTDKVPVVLNGVSSTPNDLYPPLSKAGIPSFSTGALDQASLSAPDVYLMGNPLLSVLAGPAQVAANDHVALTAVATLDNPAATGPLKQAAPLFYGNVHVKVDIVAIPGDEPDVTPQITAEEAKNPGEWQIVGTAPFCDKVFRALSSAAFHGVIVPIPTCLSGSNSGVPLLKGSILLGTNSTDPTAPEVKQYNAVMDTYAPAGLDRGANAVAGYQAVVGFARAVAGLQGDVTSATIEAAIAAMPPTPYPLADGMTFQCNHKAVTIAPNICSNEVLQTTLDAQGNGTTYTVLNGAQVLKI